MAILHLSDFHFKNAENPVLIRPDLIIKAVQSLFQPMTALIVVVTGDIAYSGTADQYAIADAFFRALLEQIAQTLPGIQTNILFVPGNHDCDLRTVSDIRDYTMLRPRLRELAADGGIISNCVAVQDQYFLFVKEFGQDHADGEKISKRIELIAGGVHRVGFSIYNTSWLSQNPERAGQLYIPEPSFLRPETPADVEVALLHHPYNWLDPENMLALRTHLQRNVDVILSGHQHHADESRVESADGNSLYAIEGMAMHDPRAPDNGFNVILLAPVDGKWRRHTYIWDSTRYTPINDHSEWTTFFRNKALDDHGFSNTPTFRSYLLDTGVAFTHSSKRTVFLNDIFVYPDLHQREIQKKIEDGKQSAALVRSKDVIRWLKEQKRVVLSGEDKCGRTALAKSVYRELQREYDFVPVLLSQGDLDSYRAGKLKQLIESAYVAQYGAGAKETFFELAASRRVLIIDDFHRSKLSAVARQALILNAEVFFESVIVFVDPTFDISCLVGTRSLPLFATYRQYQIAEMGHQLRGRLIGKWVNLRIDAWENDADGYKEALDKEKIIESLLSRRMLPSHPIIVLGMLQFLEAAKNPHTNTGSYGELYQLLITQRLASMAQKPSDVGTWYTFLSRLAFSMFSSERRAVAAHEFRAAYQEYYKIFKVHYDVDLLRENLVRIQVLEEHEGNIRFKYRDFYHFFVARYINDNISDKAEASTLRNNLEHMADRVYFEEYAGILVFYLYLAKDPDVIQRLVANARQIYAKYKPCNLESDTDFLTAMYIAPPGPVSLSDGDALTNRDAYRAQMDELDKKAPPPNDGEKLAYSEDLNDFVKINIAVKSMYILGQVLRAFPGAIKQELKTEIANECYLLGLRVLAFVIETVKEHTDELRNYFAILIREQRAVVRQSEVPTSAEEAILNVMHSWAFGMIKKISASVGLAELEATYEEVRSNSAEELSVELVDLSIRLDHFYHFPEDQVEALRERVRKNLFAFSVFRDLIVYYFSLFKSTPAIRQKWGKLLDIRASGTSEILSRFAKPNDQE
jgi:predicted phosphodiesterase